MDEFLKRMPKGVVQCPWNYCKSEGNPEYVQSVETMLEAGYDMIPDVCTFSTQSQDAIQTSEGSLLLERFTQKAYPREQLLGFLLCPWARPVPCHRTKGLKIDRVFWRYEASFRGCAA